MSIRSWWVGAASRCVKQHRLCQMQERVGVARRQRYAHPDGASLRHRRGLSPRSQLATAPGASSAQRRRSAKIATHRAPLIRELGNVRTVGRPSRAMGGDRRRGSIPRQSIQAGTRRLVCRARVTDRPGRPASNQAHAPPLRRRSGSLVQTSARRRRGQLVDEDAPSEWAGLSVVRIVVQVARRFVAVHRRRMRTGWRDRRRSHGAFPARL
jgi:hypothetical protein